MPVRVSIPESRYQPVAFAETELVFDLDVEDVELLTEQKLISIDLVRIHLQSRIGAARPASVRESDDVPTVGAETVDPVHAERRLRVGQAGADLACRQAIDVTL